jgi:hypothetical protein
MQYLDTRCVTHKMRHKTAARAAMIFFARKKESCKLCVVES